MNKTAPNPAVINALHEFYSTLLPTSSQFELPEGVRNAALHVDELMSEQPLNGQFQWSMVTGAVFGIPACLAVAFYCQTYVSVNRMRDHVHQYNYISSDGIVA